MLLIYVSVLEQKMLLIRFRKETKAKQIILIHCYDIIEDRKRKFLKLIYSRTGNLGSHIYIV